MIYRKKDSEYFTEDLSEHEATVIRDMVVEEMAGRSARSMAIGAARLAKLIRKRGEKVTTPRIKKIINLIRKTGLMPNIIEGYRGYHLAQSSAELKRYTSSLQARSLALFEVCTALNVHSELPGVQQRCL